MTNVLIESERSTQIHRELVEENRRLKEQLAESVELNRDCYNLFRDENYIKMHMEYFSVEDKRLSHETGLASKVFNRDLAERLKVILYKLKDQLEEKEGEG